MLKSGTALEGCSMRFLSCLIVAMVAATASSAQTVNWGAKSALLDLGMTEQQVMKALGYAPNKTDMETCGQQTTTGAWKCKIHTYGLPLNKLTVYFSQSPDDMACGQLESLSLTDDQSLMAALAFQFAGQA
jgi:hypothetical protein